MSVYREGGEEEGFSLHASQKVFSLRVFTLLQYVHTILAAYTVLQVLPSFARASKNLQHFTITRSIRVSFWIFLYPFGKVRNCCSPALGRSLQLSYSHSQEHNMCNTKRWLWSSSPQTSIFKFVYLSLILLMSITMLSTGMPEKILQSQYLPIPDLLLTCF